MIHNGIVKMATEYATPMTPPAIGDRLPIVAPTTLVTEAAISKPYISERNFFIPGELKKSQKIKITSADSIRRERREAPQRQVHFTLELSLRLRGFTGLLTYYIQFCFPFLE